jgi:hypothetical protein
VGQDATAQVTSELYSRGWKKVDGDWLIALQTYSPDG